MIEITDMKHQKEFESILEEHNLKFFIIVNNGCSCESCSREKNGNIRYIISNDELELEKLQPDFIEKNTKYIGKIMDYPFIYDDREKHESNIVYHYHAKIFNVNGTNKKDIFGYRFDPFDVTQEKFLNMYKYGEVISTYVHKFLPNIYTDFTIYTQIQLRY